VIQRIVYAKGGSNVIAKLRGTYVAPTAQAPAGVSTDLQRSIFAAPPGAAVTVKPVEGTPQGVKRPREEEEEEESEGEAPMEEESNVSMEASSDED
jgi:hypothetical protein